MMLRAIFMDKNHDVIDTAIVEDIREDYNNKQIVLQNSESEGFVFPGTRSVQIELHAIAKEEKEDGIQALADRLSFIIFKK